jgi:hypothetical protein
MPHAIVHFNPDLVRQHEIDELKRLLPGAVSRALNRGCETSTLHTPARHVYAGQRASHPTDQNASPFEIVIDAGMVRWRNPEKVWESVDIEISASNFLKQLLPGVWEDPENQPYLWIRFVDATFGKRLTPSVLES